MEVAASCVRPFSVKDAGRDADLVLSRAHGRLEVDEVDVASRVVASDAGGIVDGEPALRQKTMAAPVLVFGELAIAHISDRGQVVAGEESAVLHEVVVGPAQNEAALLVGDVETERRLFSRSERMLELVTIEPELPVVDRASRRAADLELSDLGSGIERDVNGGDVAASLIAESIDAANSWRCASRDGCPPRAERRSKWGAARFRAPCSSFRSGPEIVFVERRTVTVENVGVVEDERADGREQSGRPDKGRAARSRQARARPSPALLPAVLVAANPEQVGEHAEKNGPRAVIGEKPGNGPYEVAKTVHRRIAQLRR